MTVNSVTSQLLYEIQGPQYYNCDVTAQLEGIKIEQVGDNQVKVSGVKGLPPPPTTKVGLVRIFPLNWINSDLSQYHGICWLASGIPRIPCWARY